jgi:hypothetical protein
MDSSRYSNIKPRYTRLFTILNKKYLNYLYIMDNQEKKLDDTEVDTTIKSQKNN